VVVRCVLPGGLADATGTVQREVELRGLTGREEELLADWALGAAGGGPGSGAAAATAVLACCVARIGAVEKVDEAVVRRLLVGDRQFLMLKLREATFGERVQGSVRCPWPGCGERVAVSFALGDVPVTEAADPGPSYSVELEDDGGTVAFRLPTGEDQEAVAPLLDADGETAALTALLERCVHGDAADLSPRARAAVEAAMAEVAPRVDLTLEITCAECGRGFDAPLDLQDFFFGELRASAPLLHREVHQLAINYHWSEREIMEMPRERRARYLAVLSDELERLDASA
jgi:hypothetical protein